MDGLKIMSPVVSSPLPTRSAVTPGNNKTVSQAPALPKVDASAYDPQAAELGRFEQVKRMSNDNVFVVSDKSFTIFKDASGQYITRYTSLRDGRVTYIPEPKLFETTNTVADIPNMVTIKA